MSTESASSAGSSNEPTTNPLASHEMLAKRFSKGIDWLEKSILFLQQKREAMLANGELAHEHRANAALDESTRLLEDLLGGLNLGFADSKHAAHQLATQLLSRSTSNESMKMTSPDGIEFTFRPTGFTNRQAAIEELATSLQGWPGRRRDDRALSHVR